MFLKKLTASRKKPYISGFHRLQKKELNNLGGIFTPPEKEYIPFDAFLYWRYSRFSIMLPDAASCYDIDAYAESRGDENYKTSEIFSTHYAFYGALWRRDYLAYSHLSAKEIVLHDENNAHNCYCLAQLKQLALDFSTTAKPVNVHGIEQNQRQWLYFEDHADNAMLRAFYAVAIDAHSFVLLQFTHYFSATEPVIVQHCRQAQSRIFQSIEWQIQAEELAQQQAFIHKNRAVCPFNTTDPYAQMPVLALKKSAAGVYLLQNASRSGRWQLNNEQSATEIASIPCQQEEIVASILVVPGQFSTINEAAAIMGKIIRRHLPFFHQKIALQKVNLLWLDNQFTHADSVEAMQRALAALNKNKGEQNVLIIHGESVQPFVQALNMLPAKTLNAEFIYIHQPKKIKKKVIQKALDRAVIKTPSECCIQLDKNDIVHTPDTRTRFFTYSYFIGVLALFITSFASIKLFSSDLLLLLQGYFPVSKTMITLSLFSVYLLLVITYGLIRRRP